MVLAFETFSRGCILLELKIINYKLFFRVTEFAQLLRMFSRFYLHFYNLQIRSNDISQVLTINQEIFFDKSQFIFFTF